MIGVFDPKSSLSSKLKRYKKPLIAGLLATVVFGAAGSMFLLNGKSSPPEASLASLSLDTENDKSGKNVAAPAEPEIILTSFQELQDVKPTEIRTEKLKSRDTLTDLMDRLGVERVEANAALYALYDAKLIDPRKVRPGLEVTAYVEAAPTSDQPEAVRLVGMTLKHAKEASLVVSRKTDDSFSAHELHTRLIEQTRRIKGTVETSLYQAALESGAHDAQVYDFAQIFAYDVDFQREMRVGDQFEIVFEEFTDEKGRFIRSGNILFAKLNGYAVDRGFYRFTPDDDGVTDYFDEKGESATKFLMKTPINGARLSSNFGYRRHPVLGYNKLHKGTDFAAPRGTPIMAAGNGVIERASRFGSFGNYVRIRHANGYQTAYAHLNGYGPGIRGGSRVKQGQIIGYVGTTGRSTGPHLHYEVHKNGRAVNAMTLKLPTGRKLEGDALKKFALARAEIDKIRGIGETPIVFAASSSQEPETPLLAENETKE